MIGEGEIKEVLERVRERLGARSFRLFLEREDPLWEAKAHLEWEEGYLPALLLLPQRPILGVYPVTLYLEFSGKPKEPFPYWLTLEHLYPEGYIVRVAHLAKDEKEALEVAERLFSHLLMALGFLKEEGGR